MMLSGTTTYVDMYDFEDKIADAWHGETFDPQSGAIRLAWSDACQNLHAARQRQLAAQVFGRWVKLLSFQQT